MQRDDPQHTTEQGLSSLGSPSPLYCLFSFLSALLTGLYGDSERQNRPVIEREWRVSTACLLSGSKGRVRGHQNEGRGEDMGWERSGCFGSPDISLSVFGEKVKTKNIEGAEAIVVSLIPFIQTKICLSKNLQSCSQQCCTSPLLQRQSDWMISFTNFFLL